MNNTSTFHAWLDGAIASAPRTPSGIPLVGFDQIDARATDAGPLIALLAEIVASACQYSPADTPHTLPMAA